MVSVLIVDNEFWVCQLIKKIINWNELGFNIIAEAHDGIEAIEILKTKKPELVITDILMPGIDGISLMREARELGLDTEFIIISGYNEFAYAKDAVKYGALDYLLKPIDKDELTGILLKTREKFLNYKQKQNDVKVIKERLEDSISQLKDQFFFQKLNCTAVRNDINIQNINQDYGLAFAEGLFQLLIFKADVKATGEIDEYSNHVFFNTISKTIEVELKLYCYELLSLESKKKFIYIINYDISKKNKISSVLNNTFIKLLENIDIHKTMYLTLGIGDCVGSINLIHKSFSNALCAIKGRVTLGTDKIINMESQKFINIEMKELFPVDKELKLICMSEVFDVNGYRSLLYEVFAVLIKNRNINPNAIFKVAYQIIQNTLKVIQRKNIDIEHGYLIEAKVYEDIEECKSMNEVIEYLGDLLARALEGYNVSKQSHHRKAVEIVKSYVSNHYKEEISLTEVANLVYLNSNYFCELFKKETGMNFSEYVTDYRINTAKELLKDIKYKINEISELVGYKDAKYFSKLFKKEVGISPSEFRSLFTL